MRNFNKIKVKKKTGNLKLIWSMSRVDWIGGDERSSFLKEIVEFSIFLSGIIALSGLIGDSWDSNVDFCEFLERKSFSRAQFFFLWLGLFSSINKKSTLIRQQRLWRWCLVLFRLDRLPRWFVWWSCSSIRRWTIGLGVCCRRAIRSLCRVDQPFFFTKIKRQVTPPCLIS